MRALRTLVVVALMASVAAPAMAAAKQAASTGRPNILILVSDDQSYSNWNRSLMPNVFGQLVDEGVTFDRGYVNSSLCCPSRAEIMTGLYEHHNGVDRNDTPLTQPTIIEALHDAGYRTSLTGKYLNSETCDPRAEFDQWVCSGVAPSSYTLMNPNLNVNGAWTHFDGYTTDILADYVTSFIANTPTDQPFFALYTPTSPHVPADDDRCADVVVAQYRPPSFDENTMTDGKPAYVARGPLSPDETASIDDTYQDMTKAVPCLDGSIKRILDGLGPRENDTLVVYLSDNGFLFGEHRRWSKVSPYEETVRVPFVIRYPAMVPVSAPFSTEALVSNVDIAPTIADLAGIDWVADGTSLVPILNGQATQVRSGLLLDQCEGSSYPCMPSVLPYGQSGAPSFYGLVTAQYKYVEYVTGEKELYDLTADPDEMTNWAGDPGYAGIVSTLAGQLASLAALPAPDTTIVSGPQGAVDVRNVTFTYFSQSRSARFQCQLTTNGTPGVWYPCNGGSDTVGGLDSGSYVFKVKATDELGRTDPTSAQRSFSIGGATGPDVTITSAPPAHTKDTQLTFSFTSTTPGATFECQMALLEADPSFSPCASGVSYSEPDGLWAFQVRAVDGSGVRTNPPAQRLVNVDHAGPSVVFASSPPKSTKSTTASFYFYPNEKTTGAAWCSQDGGSRVDCSKGSFSTSGLGAATHRLSVQAKDELGNTSTTTFKWSVDLTPPVTTLSSSIPDGGSTSATNITITITANEALDTDNAGIGCALDGQNRASENCASQVTINGLAPGTHVFTAVTQDRAENVSAAVSWTWTILG